MYKNQILTSGDKMKFGKHLGKTIQQIANDSPTYIGWMIENIDNFAFDASLVSKLNLSPRLVSINTNKLERFYNAISRYEEMHDDCDDCYDSDWKEDTWYAMTDGAYGDMPDGFDGDYSFMGY